MQNVLLLIASVFFYGYADWRFLLLLVLSVLVNFYTGKKIKSTVDDEDKQKIILRLGILFNVGLLFWFKYFNFFVEGFSSLINVFGANIQYNTLHIILPLGISFFTFQTIGYLIDVYNEEVEASDDLLVFSLFISYFPKILSGPIERAKNFIPQLKEKRIFSYNVIVDGLRQILWGLFAKIVVAENCATIANPIFENYQEKPGSVLLIGALFYAVQLYADFSGYSNMAIGVSKLFGLNLSRNFATPFFSTNISDFWRKWHMSLTNWMMDYVFTPLSFTWRRYPKMGLIGAIVTTFILVGLWHGANWTFIVYGLMHGLYFIPIVYRKPLNKSSIVAKGKLIPALGELIKMMLLFMLIALTDIFFRTKNLTEAFYYFNGILSQDFFTIPNKLFSTNYILGLTLVLIMLVVEWMNREKTHDFEISNLSSWLRWGAYIGVFILILFFGKSAESFIYFQF
jgi:D-alanyl-lipoteichoic acid acyltransferase DltB (MBOAT superfamily)